MEKKIFKAKQLYTTLGIITLAFIIVSYNNCAKVNFSDVPSIDQNPIEVVKDVCTNGTISTSNYNISFANPNTTCPFGVDDNLDTKNGYFQARIEQNYSFSLPTDEIICDIEFNFPQQNMLYDDHMFLTFNNVVMASTIDLSSQWDFLDGLPIYNWLNIAGFHWVGNGDLEGVYCLGLAENMSSCVWPETDTNGQIQLSYDYSLIQQIMAQNLNQSSHNFKLITVGDNDDLDCEHSDINFTITVQHAK